jgi:uncharacterized protein (DUF342 family)
MEKQQPLVLQVNGGRFIVTVSEDAMTAWAEFMPARETGVAVGPELIAMVLADQHIVHGLQEKAIRKMAEECARAPAHLKLVIARGTKPVDVLPPYVQMRKEFDPEQRNGIKEDEKGHIDYREFSPFTIVQRNEYLAVQRPGIPGKQGCNVYGQELPFGVVPCRNIQAGKNIRVEQNGYYAAVCGQLLLSGELLNVENTLVIKGSVGYATGHINFPGDITIHGFVNDGFKLYSGGKITCKQTLDVTNVSAKGGLEVNGGIIGRLEAGIQVDGGVNVRFMEHCNLYSDGDITVRAEIIQSMIHTKGRLSMGEGSDIISSTIHSFHSVESVNITNSGGRMSAFYLGMDFGLEDAVHESRQRLGDLAGKRDQAKILLDKAPENRRKDMEKVYDRVESQWLAELEKLGKLLERFYVDPRAELRATGEIARGTRIEICGTVLVLPVGMKETTFRLSENRKSIIIDTETIGKSVERIKLLHGRRRVK